MQIVLFRHGIAIDREHPDCPPDPERPLTEKGARRTRRAARGLAVLGVRPDLVLASPHERTLATARIAAEVLGAGTPVEPVDALRPGAAPEAVLDLVRRRCADCTLLVGHAPDLDLLLATALDRGGRPLTLLRKAGAASVRLAGTDGAAFAELEWVLTPRALRRLGRS